MFGWFVGFYGCFVGLFIRLERVFLESWNVLGNFSCNAFMFPSRFASPNDDVLERFVQPDRLQGLVLNFCCGAFQVNPSLLVLQGGKQASYPKLGRKV